MQTLSTGSMMGQKPRKVPITEWPDVSTWILDTIPIEYNVSGSGAGLVGCVWNNDGTRLYCVADSGTGVDPVWRNTPDYSVPYVPESDTTPESVVNPTGTRLREVAWNGDGSVMIGVDYSSNRLVELVNSGTPWTPYNPVSGDVSATIGNTFSVVASSLPRSIDISPDGYTLWYVANSTGRNIYEVTLSTAFDITSGTNGSVFAPPQGDMVAMKFSPTGLKFYALGLDRVLYEYTCTVAFDISTASYSGNSIDVTNSRTPVCFDVSPDATKLVIGFFSTTSSANELGIYTV